MSEIKFRLLLIEDDSNYATVISHRLRKESNPSYDVECFDTLEAGLERLKRGDIDLTLLDLSLPDSQGLGTFEKLHSHMPLMPVIVLTGLDNESFALETLRKGAEDYVVKGQFDSKMLSRVIRYSIERHQIKRELDLANGRLENLAFLDPLTELLNRRGLQDALSREIQWSRREGTNFLVFLIDLDNFKKINDTWGHAVGDIVLNEVARKLKSSLRATDYVARIGGDEFMVLLPRTRIAEGIRVAERARLAISQSPVSLYSRGPVAVTASVGVARVSDGTPSIDELLSKTNLALHQSKREGKNKVSFEQNASNDPNSNGHLVSHILEALERGNGFHVLAEPIIQLKDGERIGYELLSHLSLEGFEMLDDFFRLCLEHNILTLVDHRCFEICLASGNSFAPTSRCHVNLFPSTLINIPVQHLIEALSRDGRKGKYCVEISEQQIIGDPSYLIGPVAALKKSDILVAIDDVGFGRSCLESLILLEPDIVKIDKRRVTGVARDPALARSLRRIVKVAESLGTGVVTGGVETEADLEFLRQLGVGYGQGLLWGKPKEIPLQLIDIKERENQMKATRKIA